jgi:putative aldouronate transport system permease protein
MMKNGMKNRIHQIIRGWQLYAMLFIPLVCLIIFSYVPMCGILLAFKDYKVKMGILGSPWVGLKYFKMFVSSPLFLQILRNTLMLNLYMIAVGFPIPIAFAIMLNEIKHKNFKKTIQTIIYAPYFLSTVIVIGMVYQLFSYSGIINTLLKTLGMERVDYLGKSFMFSHLYVWSGVWQCSGYGTVIYIAALAGVDPNLYEAALLDGASRLQKINHIDIPAILPIIVIQFILTSGSILSIGFEKVYLLQNAINISISEVISTYVYKIGLVNGEFSYGTAVGLFNSVVNLLLLVSVNWFARRVGETSLW